MSTSQPSTPSFARVLFAVLLAVPVAASAANYLVNSAGSEPDANPGVGGCATAAGTCTLRAAIMEGNAVTGPHTVKFASGVQTIVLAASLPTVTNRFTFDGSNPSNAASGGRVVIDGAQTHGCFDLVENATSVSPNGARGSTIKDFVIRRCQGNGISLSGQGYTVSGNRIGTNPGATSASGPADANGGDGIFVSGTVPLASAPNLASLLNELPQSVGAIAGFAASLRALFGSVQPNTISANVVSGNNGVGIRLVGQGTANTYVSANLVGLSADGLSAIPNGRSTSTGRDGIRIEGAAWANLIGPANIVSGNNGSGIALASEGVRLPNFIAGNLVGIGSAPADVGNAENGISVRTSSSSGNPTQFAAFIGPGNTISDNRSDAGGAGLDVVANDSSGGLLIDAPATGVAPNRVEVYGNVIGLATFPAGSTPLGQLQYGNRGNGIVVVTPNVGLSRNLILANGRHGILLRGSATTGTRIDGNFIGVSVPTGLSPLVGLGNAGDGIHVFTASSSRIGGPAASDANVIAGNGRNGIALRNGSSTAGWANLIQRNAIYGNARSGTGIGIDLERVPDAPDGFNPSVNPQNYANFDQVAPVLCGGDPPPPACGSAAAPRFDGNGTSLRWTLPERAGTPRELRVDFYALAVGGAGMDYLGAQVVNLDANGRPGGNGCDASGLCTATVGGTTDTGGAAILATATDLLPSDVPPVGDQPPAPLSAANNTSEFSLAVTARRALAVFPPPPLPAATVGSPYSVAFTAIGGTGVYTSWGVSSGALPPGLTLNPSTGVLAGTPSAAGASSFAIRVTDSDGEQASAAYTINTGTVAPLAIVTPSPLPVATSGTGYSLAFNASGGTGPYGNWSVVFGTLPPGLTLAADTGQLSGTAGAAGSYEFTVQVGDGASNLATRSYTLTVQPSPAPVAITTAAPLPAATQGQDYALNFTASGGSGSYTGWSISAGALPPGLVLGAASGSLQGRPAAAGNFAFTLRVTDTLGGIGTRSYTLSVAPAPPPPNAPSYTITPTTIDFGGVRVGTTATVPVVVRNISRAPFNPDIALAGTPLQLVSFSVSEGTCTGSLAIGATCTMSVSFRPRRGGGAAFGGTADVSTTQLSVPFALGSIRLRGVGTGRLVDLTPVQIDFGERLVGSPVTGVAVTIRNPTASTLRISGGSLYDPTGFPAPVSGCGSTLAAGASCQITYRFAPVAPGLHRSGTRLDFEQDSGLLPPAFSDAIEITLSGTGSNSTLPFWVRPIVLDFGSVQVGSSETLPVSITSQTAGNLSIAGGQIPVGDFPTFLRSGSCPNPLPGSASCGYDYSFAPRVAGAQATNPVFTISGVGPTRQVPLSLRGQGSGTIARVSPERLDFGRVPVGGTSSAEVTVTNPSQLVLTLSRSAATPFVRVGGGCGTQLLPGASCTFTYRLDGNPELVGFQTADAVIRAVDGSGDYQLEATVVLAGEVVEGLFSDGFE